MSTDYRNAYECARERYRLIGVDTEAVLEELSRQSISINCWQGDDVAGFEGPNAGLSGGGIQVTGSYPGRARNAPELRADMEKALSLIPGSHRVNLHAMYGEFGEQSIDRDEIEVEHFSGWIDWAREIGAGLDFNATLFSHPRAEAGFTLSSKDAETRDFWKEHVRRCRAIAAHMGREVGTPCIHNLWIPDGMKDSCVDRAGFRALLKESLDEIYSVRHDTRHTKDSLESKLFGIGSESYVVGSHEFYMGYASLRNLMLCLDMGHFHPTESVADKISAILQFHEEILIHVSRGVRWDSDHVVLLGDSVQELAHEIVRSRSLGRVHLALDFMDASINRVSAWVTGARAVLKALLIALLEPTEELVSLEREGNYSRRLALLEELKGMPFGAVWDLYCLREGVPPRQSWIEEIEAYEARVLSKRS